MKYDFPTPEQCDKLRHISEVMGWEFTGTTKQQAEDFIRKYENYLMREEERRLEDCPTIPPRTEEYWNSLFNYINSRHYIKEI